VKNIEPVSQTYTCRSAWLHYFLQYGQLIQLFHIVAGKRLERSKVRVKFFQSGKPQQISPPDNNLGFYDFEQSLLSDYLSSDINNISDNTMTATAVPPTYDRQISTESGWDNPFRPGGDLSREADEIVNMIKGGKPITPTGDLSQNFANGAAQTNNHTLENGTAVVDGATRAEVSQVQSTKNGFKSPQKDKKNGDAAPQTQISNQVMPGPQSASHVVIDDKKKKKCTCCVIQ